MVTRARVVSCVAARDRPAGSTVVSSSDRYRKHGREETERTRGETESTTLAINRTTDNDSTNYRSVRPLVILLLISLPDEVPTQRTRTLEIRFGFWNQKLGHFLKSSQQYQRTKTFLLRHRDRKPIRSNNIVRAPELSR